MIGFGISSPADVKNALRLGDVAVVGSAIIKKLQASDVAGTLKYVGELAGAAR
jgi:tryptophan synthase alpha subunit